MLGFEIILDGVALLTTTQEKNREWLELKKILWGQPIVVNKLKQTVRMGDTSFFESIRYRYRYDTNDF